MSKNRSFNVLVVVALLVVAALTAWEAAAIAEVVPADRSAAAAAINSGDRPSNQDALAPRPSYRSRGDECFDVPLSELAACRLIGQNTIEVGQEADHTRRLPANVCFDVPLGEVCDK